MILANSYSKWQDLTLSSRLKKPAMLLRQSYHSYSNTITLSTQTEVVSLQNIAGDMETWRVKRVGTTVLATTSEITLNNSLEQFNKLVSKVVWDIHFCKCTDITHCHVKYITLFILEVSSSVLIVDTNYSSRTNCEV